jgi:hypothetical protein
MIPKQDEIASSAKRQLDTASTIAQQAALSGAWRYPVVGIYHLLSSKSYLELCADNPDPSLIQPVLPTLIKGTAVSFGIVVALFIFTYLPQVAVLAFVSGPLGKHIHTQLPKCY